MLHIFKGPHGIDNGPTDIWFGNEERVGGNLQWPGVARRNDDVNGWPSIPNASSEFQSVHRAGHVDVRKDKVDVRAGFEYGDGRVGAVCEYHVIARLLQLVLEKITHQEFIFNDENSSHVPDPSFTTRRDMDKSSNDWKGSNIRRLGIQRRLPVPGGVNYPSQAHRSRLDPRRDAAHAAGVVLVGTARDDPQSPSG
jgi:hypothetical protein